MSNVRRELFWLVLSIIMLVVVLASCGAPEPKPVDPMKIDRVMGTAETGRFKIVLASYFDDGLAYRGQRGIYLLTDTLTGREYVGISGVGISEVGWHTEGSGDSKKTVEDER